MISTTMLKDTGSLVHSGGTSGRQCNDAGQRLQLLETVLEVVQRNARIHCEKIGENKVMKVNHKDTS